MEKGGKIVLKNEKQVVKLIEDRLELGRTRYGGDIPINGEKHRDNLKEAIEEALDLSVYTASLLIEKKNYLNRFLKAYHLLMGYWDQFDHETQTTLDKKLKELGL